ncbi:MAG: hypothetical protein M3033_17130 [Acidobacteriota bacterium]|nr:hypothetical protein [Acidobacteriota bacterium]
MKAKSISISFFLVVFLAQLGFAQTLPTKIKSYLDRNYKGWKLTKDECGGSDSKAVVTGNFNGDKKLDYAVKITRAKKGFIFAFLAQNQSYKAFVLHNTDAQEVKYSSLDIWKKGEVFEYEGKSFRLRYDAPSDYHCESDVGGIHYYRNGKFIAY